MATTSGGGDTNGYTHNGSAWFSVVDGTKAIAFNDSNPANSTYDKSIRDLLDEGWIDAGTSNLVAAHDAATAHWGSEWRMPTKAELDALTKNCTGVLTNLNGKSGRLFTSTNNTNQSIFIPAAGYGSDASHYSAGSSGSYWSGSPDEGESDYAWRLNFNQGMDGSSRYCGFPVRAVADKAPTTSVSADGEVVASGESAAYGI